MMFEMEFVVWLSVFSFQVFRIAEAHHSKELILPPALYVKCSDHAVEKGFRKGVLTTETEQVCHLWSGMGFK